MPRLLWWEAKARLVGSQRHPGSLHRGKPAGGVRSQRWSWDAPGIMCQAWDTQHPGHGGSELLLRKPRRLLEQLEHPRKPRHAPWGSLRECWWILIAHLCLLLVYQRILQQTVITMREGGNRKIWRKTSRVKGVSPTDSTHQPHGFTQTGFGCRPLHLLTHGMGSQASAAKPVCTFPLAHASRRLVETKDTSGGVYLSLGKVTCLGIDNIFQAELPWKHEFSLSQTKRLYMIEK